MTTLVLNNFAIKFGLTIHLVRSWWEHMNFISEEEAEVFFEQNLDMIKAKPFIKWVG